MAGFVQWLASRYEKLRSELKEEHAVLREAASTSTQHRRTPGIIANLALGLRYFLLFANEVGALSEAEAEEFWVRGWRALGEAATAQSQHQTAGEPTQRFRELLSAAVASGRAHVANPRGDRPNKPEAWGWRLGIVGTGEYEREEWRPQGECVGWVEGEELYLQPDAAYAAVQKQGRDSGDALTVTSTTLRKRLHERGLLKSTDQKRQVLTVRRTLASQRRDVLHLRGDFLSTLPTKPDQPDHEPQQPHRYEVSVPPLWSGQGFRTRPAPDHEPDQEPQFGPDDQVSGEHWSGNGREPDREPDHQEPLIHAENWTNGRVGRIFDTGREESGNQGAYTRRVRGRI
jgi:hypothetical protein